MKKVATLGSWLKEIEKIRLFALVLTLLIFLLVAVSLYLENIVFAFVLVTVVLIANLILDWQWNVRLSRPKRKVSLKTWLLGILLAVSLGGLIGALWS